MPNWCKNKLMILGDGNRVAEFVFAARGKSQKFKQSGFDIYEEKYCKEKQGDKYIPYSEVMHDFSFHQLVSLPREVEDEKYNPNGYNAEMNTWGIKWGAIDSALISFDRSKGLANYTFRTPYSPGKIFFTKLSDKWTDLKFALSYTEEFPSMGRFLLQNNNFQILIDETRFKGSSCKYINSHNKWIRELLKEVKCQDIP